MRGAHGDTGGGGLMDIRDLRCFGAVAETLSMSRAAREARVAQPALSRRIRALESELGVALLSRHPKGVRLTPAGAAFADGSRQLLRDLAGALDRADTTAAGQRGRVVVAATRPAVARGFPTEVQESLRDDHPEVTVVVQDWEPPGVWDAVADGRADAAVCMENPSLPGLVAEPLWGETLDRAIVPRDHPLAARSTVSLRELASLPLVVSRTTVDPDAIAPVAGTLQRAGLQSPVLMLPGDLRGAHLAVAAGRGWTLVSRSRAQSPPQGTAVLIVKGIAVAVGMKVVWREGERRPVVRTVLQRMLEVARSYPETQVRAAAALPPPPPRPGRARRLSGTVPPGVELRHLRALVTVAAARTIGQAAARLGIRQPTLSRQLSELEHTLGVTLLERSPRGAALTAAGASLAGDTPDLLAAAQRLVREATRAKRGIEGLCVIGTVATGASSALLLRVTERCGARHPEIEMLIKEMATPEQRAALVHADIDLGLAHAFPTTGRARAGAIVATRVQADRLDTALLPSSHPLAARRRLDARKLAEVPFLFMDRSFHPGFYARLHAVFARLGLRPRVEATYDGLSTVWTLVAQGKGWTVGFHSHLARPPAGTVAVPIAGFSLLFGLELLSRRGESSPPVLAVAKVFREAGQPRRQTTPRRA